ncbi:hypothetical protein [Parabacteroides sp. PF5-9]|uniref:hypothetical protein n=1 Tax=Parabacteroides sp. PF5-9 TaxID=1742404 RepID=UPI002473D98A|nr:hypothetical protein [Parabacteroides sp. PF5-9]MDH6356947.1 hypothetical protein [Parabacteroides sp. PF5-9]
MNLKWAIENESLTIKQNQIVCYELREKRIFEAILHIGMRQTTDGWVQLTD